MINGIFHGFEPNQKWGLISDLSIKDGDLITMKSCDLMGFSMKECDLL